MKTGPKECLTLREYREEVLRMPQAELARHVGCQQAWISRVERGHLPRPWNRAALLRSYRLDGMENEFERLVIGGRKQGALRLPISETEPLFANIRADQPAEITPLNSESGQKAREA